MAAKTETVRYVGHAAAGRVVVYGDLEYECAHGVPVDLPYDLVHRAGGLLDQGWELVTKPAEG
jgi:hypothetical protein